MYHFFDQEPQENIWGQISLLNSYQLYMIEVQWKAQLVVFQLCSNIVCHDDEEFKKTSLNWLDQLYDINMAQVVQGG